MSEIVKTPNKVAILRNKTPQSAGSSKTPKNSKKTASLKNLVRASDAVANSNLNHLVISLSVDGLLQFNGSSKIVKAFNNDMGLKYCLKKKFLENVHPEEEDKAAGTIVFPLLPCSPSSPDWKKLGIDQLRSILIKMIQVSGKKLKEGEPPKGWPAHVIEWAEYAGASRSCLKKPGISTIILSMLEGAGIDPENYLVGMKDVEGGTTEAMMIEDELDQVEIPMNLEEGICSNL